MRKLALVLGGIAWIAAAPTVVSADESFAALSGERVMITNFKGKPPFKRRIVSADALPTTDLARLEPRGETVAGDAGATERVRVADFRGKPPFKRSVVEIEPANVTELARFEPVAEERAAPARPRFPGKRFPLRPRR